MKKLILAVMILSGHFPSYCQHFIQGLGLSVMTTRGSGFPAIVTGGITYSPRFIVKELENGSLTIGLPLSLGLSYSPDTRSNFASASALINLPLVFNYNYGSGSTRHNASRFGFFAGAGWGYHAADYAGNDNNGYAVNRELEAVGPLCNVGVRVRVGRHSHNMEWKASYMKGVNTGSADIFGFAAIFNF